MRRSFTLATPQAFAPFIHRVCLFILISLLFGLSSAQNISGSNLSRVEVGPGDGTVLGAFEQSDAANWVEKDASGNITSTFIEVGRDDWSVYLYDESRNVSIQLDVYRNMVVYSDSANRFDLYVINQAFANSTTSATSSTTAKPINHYTYLGTHNAIASYSYGYITQNSQRYSVTTQLNGGVRMLEIDIVYDTPDDRFPAGVYICHCGQAPHSYSASELARAADFKSTIPLPAWSVGVPYGRFYQVLGEIDDWLVANPTEIVFIMPENNNATTAQFDAEVDKAQLQTRTYIKPSNQTQWPTRQELINTNERLIILAADGPDLAGSRYANSKGSIAWKGKVKPEMYGGDKPSAPSSSDDSKFTTLGNFLSSPTDAVTSRIFNDYDEMKARLNDWWSAGYSRAPTFIQVNQVQVGSALEIVNELNGPDYQLSATFPEDPAGDWIVDASADTAQWFYQAGVDAGVWLEGAAKDVGGEILSWINGKETTPGVRTITFNNQAGYVAYMTVTYFENQTIDGVTIPMFQIKETPDLTAGLSRSIEVPDNLSPGMPITVAIVAYGTFEDEVFTTTVSDSFAGDVCYKAWGTIFDTEGGSCD